ncbi:MAG: Rpp14/Pop5 family protein, partial [Candidatus Micrarchaeota archaeon]
GASEAALQLKAFNSAEQLMLVKSSLASHQKVIAALALKNTFRGEKVAIRSQKVYGTLDKAKVPFPSLKERKGKK